MAISTEDQSLRQEQESPPLARERTQLKLGITDVPLREFVVSGDTAHIRSVDQKMARDLKSSSPVEMDPVFGTNGLVGERLLRC